MVSEIRAIHYRHGRAVASIMLSPYIDTLKVNFWNYNSFLSKMSLIFEFSFQKGKNEYIVVFINHPLDIFKKNMKIIDIQ